jgi:pimeloyl-ACP methyl ester carboxylesterase
MVSAISGSRLSEVAWRLAGGPTLRGALSAGRQGERLLFLHGYGDSGRAWLPVVEHLPSGWRIAAPDQRGHGRSDHPAAGYTVAALAEDAARLLDALGWANATVVGHSMGGLVAQRLAIDHPARIARLVLVGTTPRCAGPAVDELVATVAAFGDEVPRDFVEAFQASTVARALPPAFFAALVDESCRVPVHVWRALAPELAAYDVRGELAHVAAPTHVVWGDADAFFGRADQAALLAGIAGAELTVYRGAGHSPHWEEPQRFARDLAGFVAGGPGGPLH